MKSVYESYALEKLCSRVHAWALASLNISLCKTCRQVHHRSHCATVRNSHRLWHPVSLSVIVRNSKEAVHDQGCHVLGSSKCKDLQVEITAANCSFMRPTKTTFLAASSLWPRSETTKQTVKAEVYVGQARSQELFLGRVHLMALTI